MVFQPIERFIFSAIDLSHNITIPQVGQTQNLLRYMYLVETRNPSIAGISPHHLLVVLLKEERQSRLIISVR